jgi:large subunit ribosomal protein L17
MRHKRNTQNLSRFSSYFKATMRSITRSVIIHQSIVTTKVRAHLVQPRVESLITLGKKVDSIAARRRAFAILSDHALVQRLFNDIAPMFTERHGGYTRIIPYKRRRGDNAEMVILELTVKKAGVSPVKSETPAQDVSKEAVVEKPKAAPKVHTLKPKMEESREPKKVSKKPLGGITKLFKQDKGGSK